MSPEIDPSILHALSLESSTAKIASHGSSDFTSTFRITTTSDPSRSFFVKTSSSLNAATMFEGEHTSLNAIHSTVPSLCPKSLAWGKMSTSQPTTYFLVTEFISLNKTTTNRLKFSRTGSGMTLARKLAILHSTPAPIPSGHKTSQFGFPVHTSCGSTPQPNPWTSTWPTFFAQNRLLFILRHGETTHGKADLELRSLVTQTAEVVVPRLLGEGHLGGAKGIVPVVVHGDLWAGNCARGRFADRERRGDGNTDADVDVDESEEEEGEEEDIIYDPSSTYAHSEYELGIMRMFGGFDDAFMREYHSLVPKTEPEEEYEDRVALYEAYHQLNHWAIFGAGAGYRGRAARMLQRLLRRYGLEGDRSRDAE